MPGGREVREDGAEGGRGDRKSRPPSGQMGEDGREERGNGKRWEKPGRLPPFIGRSCVTSFAWTMVTLPPEPGQLSAQQAGCSRGDTRATRRSL